MSVPFTIEDLERLAALLTAADMTLGQLLDQMHETALTIKADVERGENAR
jgi:hypothetical protein